MLILGAKLSQDVFHEATFSNFGDIPYCFNQQDDILIGGAIVADHYLTIVTVLQHAKDYIVTLNRKKCLFGAQEFKFYGYRFTREGLILKITHEKVKRKG